MSVGECRPALLRDKNHKTRKQMKTNKFLTLGLLGLCTLGLTSCSDADDEISNVLYGRIFSPVNLEAKSVKETSATLTWTAASGAASYNVQIFPDDSLTFAGTPINFTTSTNSLALTNLVYDTKYSVRVQAVDSADSERDSKWSSVYFRTSAQQIFNALGEEDIADRTVTLSWPAGESATSISILSDEGAVVTTHNITAEELAAGVATVSGLSPETTYTAKLYNSGKERGSKKFTTIMDLNGATVVRTSDDLKSLLENATDGQTFALYGGKYTIASEEDSAGCAIISKNISIKGIYPTNQPTINGRFQLNDGAALSLSQLKLDGKGTSGDQCFVYKTAGVTYGALDCQNVEIKNYNKGLYYVNVASTIESITFNNCLIHDIVCEGGDLFDCRKGYIKTFTLTNSTVYNCAQDRDFIRYDDASSTFGSPVPVINVTGNTINNCLNNTSGKRLLYVRFNGKTGGQQITWKNNLITNTKAVYTNQSSTSTPDYYNNYYFNCQNANIFSASSTTDKLYWNGDTSGSNGSDPQYTDAAKGDFTIGNEDVWKLGVGDPRWLSTSGAKARR